MVKLGMRILRRDLKVLYRRCGDALDSMPLADFNEIRHDMLGTKPFPSPLRRDSVGERPAVMPIYL